MQYSINKMNAPAIFSSSGWTAYTKFDSDSTIIHGNSPGVRRCNWHSMQGQWHRKDWTHVTALHDDGVLATTTMTDMCRPMRWPKYFLVASKKSKENISLCCRDDVLFCLWFINSTLYLCYGTVYIPPSTNKTSVVYLLETLDGNALKSDFFFFFFPFKRLH